MLCDTMLCYTILYYILLKTLRDHRRTPKRVEKGGCYISFEIVSPTVCSHFWGDFKNEIPRQTGGMRGVWGGVGEGF